MSLALRLSDDQRNCVEWNADSPLLVKGIAGSGKTTVIVARAVLLSRRRDSFLDSSDEVSARIFTFNRSLAAYVRALAASFDDVQVSVTHFHAWARDALAAM